MADREKMSREKGSSRSGILERGGATDTSPRKKPAEQIFIVGFFLGILAFIAVYGIKVLDVTHDGWIFKSDIDLRQHYLGWMAFRNSPWSFPFGMTDKLSFPYEMSIVYTDSIPLAALFFKIIAPLLPKTFQYFGLYGLLCFGLTGGFGAQVLGRITKRRAIAVLMTIPLILSFPLLQRTFYHTSLASQWLILWAFDLWFSGKLIKKLRYWVIMGILCAGIHVYFLPFVACIFCGAYLENLLSIRGRGSVFGIIRSVIAGLALMCVAAALTLWGFGAFGTAGTSEGYWIGDFTMNLSSFINSMGKSILLPKIPLYGEMQFEGAVYPGLGILELLFTAVFLILTVSFMLRRTVLSEDDPELSSRKQDAAGSMRMIRLKNHPRRISLIAVAMIFLIAATLPTVAFGNLLLFRIPYPEWLSRILGIFRANGRFAWGALYILIFSLVKFLDLLPPLLYSVKDRWRRKDGVNPGYPMAFAFTVIAVILNVADFMPWMAERHAKYLNPPESYVTVWEEAGLPEGYKGFVTFEKDNTFNMGTAYYAMHHDMTLNYFYFARDINEQIEGTLAGHKDRLKQGKPEDGYVYVLDRSTWEELKGTPGLYFYPTRKCAFAVGAPIPGMEELTDESAAQIRWRSDM